MWHVVLKMQMLCDGSPLLKALQCLPGPQGEVPTIPQVFPLPCTPETSALLIFVLLCRLTRLAVCRLVVCTCSVFGLRCSLPQTAFLTHSPHLSITHALGKLPGSPDRLDSWEGSGHTHIILWRAVGVEWMNVLTHPHQWRCHSIRDWIHVCWMNKCNTVLERKILPTFTPRRRFLKCCSLSFVLSLQIPKVFFF